MNEHWPNEGRESEECRASSREIVMGKIGLILVIVLGGVFTAIVAEPLDVSREQVIEAGSALLGVLGTLVLAVKSRWSGWGFVVYLASNAGWMWFADFHHHQFMFLQQVAFAICAVIGVWFWLVKGRV